MNISERREILKKSRKQEKGVAKRFGGYTQPRSGAGPFRKNDVRDKEFLYECKLTVGVKSISIKEKDLRDIYHNAVMDGRVGVLQFELNDRPYVILREEDFHAVLGR